jgi:pre-mRNA-splicing helicase BRR2
MAAAGKHQVLIFVHSGKETVKVACAIRDTALANDIYGEGIILTGHREL